MKVIDLLNRIANGEEVPKKIQVYSDIFVLNCSNMVYETERTRTNLLSIYNGNILNYEVAIIEDKKIEKIIPTSLIGIDNLDEKIEVVHIDTINAIDKINKIIKVINEMREDK